MFQSLRIGDNFELLADYLQSQSSKTAIRSSRSLWRFCAADILIPVASFQTKVNVKWGTELINPVASVVLYHKNQEYTPNP